MLCAGEHVHGLYFSDRVARGKEREVTGLRGGIAAHIDNARRGYLQEFLDYLGVHARARRVGDDTAGEPVTREEFILQEVEDIAGIEGGVV